jgi:hypothetical protein
MKSLFFRAACGFTLALVSLSAGSVSAQDAVLAEFYGSGVHHYFAGNPAQAASDLTAAIDGGTKDPRAYYFRALAEMKLGRQDAAAADMKKGAALESADINQFYPVGKSLERVQGPARLAIERYRAVARVETHRRQQQRDAVRYEQRRHAEEKVLRSPSLSPPPPKPSQPVAEPADEDPFEDKADDKPAGEEAKPADDADGAEEMPADDKAPAAADDQDADAEKPDAKDSDAKSGDDNPFGDDQKEDK